MVRTNLLWAAFLTLAALQVHATDRLVKQSWHLLESENFSVMTNTRGDTPEALISDLELFRTVVLAITNASAVKDRLPTRALVFRTRREFLRVSGASNIAGYMRATLRGNYMVSGGSSRSMDQRSIMFHEYVHHLLRSASTVNYPSWYDEGFADVLSTIYEADGKVVIGGVSSVRMNTLKNNPMQISLERVVHNDDLSSWHRYHVSYFYGISWALVNYLQFGHMMKDMPNRVTQLQTYLSLVQRNVERPRAFEEAFKINPRGMEKELNNYLGKNRRPVMMIPRDRFAPVGPIRTRSMSNQEVALALARQALYRSPEYARSLINEQLEDDPRDAQLTNVLGLTYQMEEQYKEADKYLQEAARMDPGDPVLAIDVADLLAIWNAAVCAKNDNGCEERGSTAEAEYRRALELAPDNPEANARYASFLQVADRDLPAAKKYIDFALEYQPWAPSLHLVAGLINQGLADKPGAREHLLRTLHWSKSASIREQAAAALAELDDEQRKAK